MCLAGTGSSRSTASRSPPTDRPTIQAPRRARSTLTVERGGKTVAARADQAGEDRGATASSARSASRSGSRGDGDTKEIGRSLSRLVTGDGRKEISSPVGIVQGSSEAVEQGYGHLPLGARPDQPLARAPEPAAAAAARRRPHRVLAHRGDPRQGGHARGLRARLGGRDRSRPAALLHRPHERHRPAWRASSSRSSARP